MKSNNFNNLIIVLAFMIAGVLSWRLYFKVYTQSDTVDIAMFPSSFQEWNSVEIPISETEKAILETDNAFVRNYTGPLGQEILLFIVYSQNNRKVSHPPEICYTGAGATILSNVHNTIPSTANGPEIRANQVTVELRNNKQIFFYWFKVGDTFTSNYWKQQGLIAIKSLLGKPSSSALIRISTIFNEGQDEKAIRHIKEFGSLIRPYLTEYIP